MQSNVDVVIVGGGVIGCSIAYHLSKRGVMVAVFDRGEIGAETSSAATGLLAPLGPLSGPGPFAELLQMHWLTGDEARQMEPLLAADVCAAIYLPEESQIKASHVVKAFFQAAVHQGAILYCDREIVGVQRQDTKITGVYTSQGDSFACNHLVIAAGSWADHCNTWLNVTIPIIPQRGQVLSLHQSSPPLHHIIFGEAAYLTPKSGNRIIVGATKEEVGFSKSMTAGGIAWLLNTAISFAPALECSPLEHMWAGLRPRTPDNQPILGPAPGWDNVTLAIGHGSVGIMLSAITGQTIAELILKGEVPKLVQPFSLARFKYNTIR